MLGVKGVFMASKMASATDKKCSAPSATLASPDTSCMRGPDGKSIMRVREMERLAVSSGGGRVDVGSYSGPGTICICWPSSCSVTSSPAPHSSFTATKARRSSGEGRRLSRSWTGAGSEEQSMCPRFYLVQTPTRDPPRLPCQLCALCVTAAG